ncbi:MAG: DUF4870 domain-containing protein [Proteobacteria bacterium]|nr:DUF4870 domain-containing protein [Pseudomonadota bacterium]
MGMVIYYEMIISPSDSYSLSGPNTVDKTTFHANPGTLARFTITADITTPSVQEDPDSLDDKYLARFKFPISYTISDASDKILVKEATVLVWRDKDPYLNDMGREAANFQLTMLVYYLISFVLCFVLIGFVLISAAMIFHLSYIIIGAIQTSRGADYRYPMIIRFIKA